MDDSSACCPRGDMCLAIEPSQGLLPKAKVGVNLRLHRAILDVDRGYFISLSKPSNNIHTRLCIPTLKSILAVPVLRLDYILLQDFLRMTHPYFPRFSSTEFIRSLSTFTGLDRQQRVFTPLLLPLALEAFLFASQLILPFDLPNFRLPCLHLPLPSLCHSLAVRLELRTRMRPHPILQSLFRPHFLHPGDVRHCLLYQRNHPILFP
jgi:hypothetical protein